MSESISKILMANGNNSRKSNYFPIDLLNIIKTQIQNLPDLTKKFDLQCQSPLLKSKTPTVKILEKHYFAIDLLKIPKTQILNFPDFTKNSICGVIVHF